MNKLPRLQETFKDTMIALISLTSDASAFPACMARNNYKNKNICNRLEQMAYALTRMSKNFVNLIEEMDKIQESLDNDNT
jgi:hypothetical protein